jgi:CubicO group peptidase (beta-lactamase class C family)
LATDHINFNEKAALAKVLEDNAKPNSLPGKQYAYSNIGYWMLGKIIEGDVKQDYTDYVRKNIFQPLRLTPDDIDFAITDDTQRDTWQSIR